MLASDLLAMYREEKAAYERNSFPTYEEWKEQEKIVTSTPQEDLEYYELYKAERAEAPGEFKTFAAWKKEYDASWKEDHGQSTFVPLELGVELTDSEVAFIS